MAREKIKNRAREKREHTNPRCPGPFLLPSSGPGNRTAFILKKEKATTVNSSQDMNLISLLLLIFSILFVFVSCLAPSNS